MTITIKAFGTNNALIDNANDSVARLGELSPISRTFSRQLREYSDLPYPGIGLKVFYARDGAVDIIPQMSYTTRLVEIIDYCFERATVTNQQATAQDFIVALTNRFEGVISAVQSGVMIAVPGYRMPASLRFNMTPDSMPVAQVELWFADNEFQSDYDHFSMEIIHPVSNLNVFVQNYAAVQEAIKARPADVMMQLAEASKKGVPSTRIVPHTVRWYSNSDGKTVDVTFYLAIWGPRGNTADNINAAIRNALLNQSSISEASWKIVLPDLFRVTRFFVVPNWQQRSIPDGSVAGMYSPIFNFGQARALMYAGFPETENAENDDRIEGLQHPFRSIGLVLLAGLDNRDGAKTIMEVIPDYIGQESGGDDFNRQSDGTMNWVSQMGSAIRLAENYDMTETTIPLGLDIVIQNNKRCVRVKIAAVEFLILCRVETM